MSCALFSITLSATGTFIAGAILGSILTLAFAPWALMRLPIAKPWFLRKKDSE